MKKLSIALAVAFVLVGCASDPVEKYAKQQEALKDIAVEEAKAKLDSAPDWYIAPPKNDGYGLVGVGAASSKDMHLAVKKARLQAEFELAKNYRQELSGSERSYEREDAAGNLVQASQFLIDKLVDSVPIVGYDLVDQKVMVLPDGKFQAFTLLKLPFDEFNKVLQSIKADSQDAKELEAFNDLERRLEAKRARKSQDEERDHARKLELMDQQNKVLSGATSRAIPPAAEEPQAMDVPSKKTPLDAAMDLVN